MLSRSAVRNNAERVGDEMADDKTPKAIIHMPAFDGSTHSRPEPPLPLSKPMRTLEELMPIALQAAQNTELMQKFRGVIGSDDKERASAVTDEVERFAQSVDPTVTPVDATSITVLLMKIVGHPGDRSNDGR